MDKYSGAVGKIVEVLAPNIVKLSVDEGLFGWSPRWFTREA